MSMQNKKLENTSKNIKLFVVPVFQQRNRHSSNEALIQILLHSLIFPSSSFTYGGEDSSYWAGNGYCWWKILFPAFGSIWWIENGCLSSTLHKCSNRAKSTQLEIAFCFCSWTARSRIVLFTNSSAPDFSLLTLFAFSRSTMQKIGKHKFLSWLNYIT